MIHLTDHLAIHPGIINVGILRWNDAALLFDYGGGDVEETLRELDVRSVERILFTHHHRDQADGARDRAERGTRIGVPAAEREWFEAVETYWNDPKRRWHLYDDRPRPPMLAASIPVHDAYRDGDVLEWGPARITAIETPGHTDGSLSYLVEVDGMRVVFSGDLLYDDAGRVWDVYSLQKGEATLTDYHGFMGARREWAASLSRIRKWTPDCLVPSHGTVIRDPHTAIRTALNRMETCYDRYVAASALRYYFRDLFTDFEGAPGHLPRCATKPAPSFLRHVGTSWILVSESGELFVMDCGGSAVIEAIQTWIDQGEATAPTELWITHYHDDHVDAIEAFQERFDCVIRADATVADVVTNPRAHRIPCISPAVARIDARTADGESWQWNEFTMTAYHFPGQTLYHGGLLVEGRGVRLFFVGDSFTPTGIDDYCAPNRDLLGEGIGFDRCLAILKETQPTHCFNCHVDVAFVFSDDEIDAIRSNLREREQLFGDWIAWDHPNYGLDPHWVRADPYEQTARRGEAVTIRVAWTNHSDVAKELEARPLLPSGWRSDASVRRSRIGPRSDGLLPFRCRLPEDASPGRVVIPFEIVFDGTRLGAFRETVLVVE